jgi:hypothetical protein
MMLSDTCIGLVTVPMPPLSLSDDVDAQPAEIIYILDYSLQLESYYKSEKTVCIYFWKLQTDLLKGRLFYLVQII